MDNCLHHWRVTWIKVLGADDAFFQEQAGRGQAVRECLFDIVSGEVLDATRLSRRDSRAMKYGQDDIGRRHKRVIQ